MNENEKPEIGTSEAAVLTVVELIARAAQMSEQHMAYWLDLYYQVRSRREKEMTPLDFSELMVKVEEPDPVLVRLDRIEAKFNEILSTPQPTGLSVNPIEPLQIRPVERIAEADMDAGIGKFGDYVEKRIEEAENRSKKTEADGRGSPQGPEEGWIG